MRELPLLKVPDNVEDDAATLKGQSCNIYQPVLVCISTYPNSLQLPQRGARIASYMNVEFYAVFVKDIDRFLTTAENLHFETSEKLGQEFNRQFLWLNRTNIAKHFRCLSTESRYSNCDWRKPAIPVVDIDAARFFDSTVSAIAQTRRFAHHRYRKKSVVSSQQL